jgi:tetratricopeptide (TPR) repeat protein
MAATALAAGLEDARDAQDRDALKKQITALQDAASKSPKSLDAQFRLALAHSYLAEVALELRDRNEARAAAEAGIPVAERAVGLNAKSAPARMILGTLCAQVIPANVLAGLKYGKCAMKEVDEAIAIDPKSAEAWIRHGVGNYYLPAQFGGGTDLAIKDFEKALQLNPKSAEGYLWLGIALRKANRNAEARKALAKAVELNPKRIWAKDQLAKTPVN